MFVKIDNSWKSILEKEFSASYFQKLTNFVKEQYQTKTCYPKYSEIFSAFNSCEFDKIKIVIIGQDPYHGVGQANGLCFSVNEGIALPPSLNNIFKEIQADLGKPFPKTGNLDRWAKQGVLLLNTTLTVEQAKARSHQNKGWETFTDAVIKIISDKKENIVFLIWGGFAKSKTKLIDTSKHHILNSGHPSPMSANRGYWFGNKHFSKTNEFLKSKKIKEIEW